MNRSLKTLKSERGAYHAVSIKPDAVGCCDAARDQSTTMYLSDQVPLLPLPDCTNHAECRCKYQHWDDRRQEDRRSLRNGIAAQYFDGDERRTSKDRRGG